jgi:hypothetical protein
VDSDVDRRKALDLPDDMPITQLAHRAMSLSPSMARSALRTLWFSEPPDIGAAYCKSARSIAAECIVHMRDTSTVSGA